MLRPLGGSLVVLTFALVALGQPATDTGGKDDVKKPAPKGVAGDAQVHFLDGTIIRMIVQSEKLDIVTEFGKLAVPVKDIVSIDFGLRYPDGVAAKIEAAIQKLGGVDFRERDKATKALVELGPLAYPAVLEARRSTDLETSRRAKDIVKQLQDAHAKKDLRTTTEDKVVTSKFTIIGHIENPAIKATTDLFGPVELTFAKMQTLRSLHNPGRPTEVAVGLDAAKYANLGQWLDSGFEVSGNAKVSITATGMVDMQAQAPGNLMGAPTGRVGLNNRIAPGAKVPQILPQVHGAMLLGRIGEDGDVFFVGSHYEGTFDKEGKLYLHIAPSPWGQSSGTYDVKISVN